MSRLPVHAAGRCQQSVLPSSLATAVSVALTGFGFAAAFGWLWFPSLRDVLLPDLFAEAPEFRPLAFGLALAAGCLLYSAVCAHLEKGTTRQQWLNVFLAHGLCLALLGLTWLCSNESVAFVSMPGGLSEILAGLAASLPGVWWFLRLLAHGPARAVVALAWAALAALLLSIPLMRVRGWLPGRLAEEPDMAFLVLFVCIVAGLITALFLLWQEQQNYAAASARQQPSPDRPGLATLSAASFAGALVAAVLLLFGLGALSVFVCGLGAFFPAAVHVGGLALSACILTGAFRNRVPKGEPGAAVKFPDAGPPVLSPRRCILAGACGLALLSLCLPAFPTFAHVLFPLGASLAEAASLALCAVALGRAESEQCIKGPGTLFTAGVTLVALLAAVNTGYLVGTTLMSVAGTLGPVLPSLAVALLLGASAPYGIRTYHAEPGDVSAYLSPRAEEASPYAAEESGIGVPDGGELSQKTTKLHPAIAAQLTERERVLALLLVRGYSNKEVAETLGLSENTVRWYIKKLNKRTGATDRPGLIAALLSECFSSGEESVRREP